MENHSHVVSNDFIDREVVQVFENWRDWLSSERRLAENTQIAYVNDVTAFFHFFSEHIGSNISMVNLQQLTITDLRSFLANRKRTGLSNTSMARKVSSIRNFFYYLKRREMTFQSMF